MLAHRDARDGFESLLSIWTFEALLPRPVKKQSTCQTRIVSRCHNPAKIENGQGLGTMEFEMQCRELKVLMSLRQESRFYDRDNLKQAAADGNYWVRASTGFFVR
jgi:hypothetical protein